MALLIVPMSLSAALSRVDGQAGDRSVTPIAMTDLEPKYRHAVGALDLDLSRLQLPAGSRTPIDITMGVGQVDVIVPWDADVESKASVGAGTFDLFGNRQTGVNLEGRSRSTGQPGAPVLVISGEAGIGEVIVRRAYEPFTQQALRTGQPVPLQCSFCPGPSGIRPPQPGPARCLRRRRRRDRDPAVDLRGGGVGTALCRPTGEPEPAVDFADDPGTRRCQVPAGGGDVDLHARRSPERRLPAEDPSPARSPKVAARPSADPPGQPEHRTRTLRLRRPPRRRRPIPTPPTEATTPPATAAPGEYRCTVPEGGGPATCEPA